MNINNSSGSVSAYLRPAYLMIVFFFFLFFTRRRELNFFLNSRWSFGVSSKIIKVGVASHRIFLSFSSVKRDVNYRVRANRRGVACESLCVCVCDLWPVFSRSAVCGPTGRGRGRGRGRGDLESKSRHESDDELMHLCADKWRAEHGSRNQFNTNGIYS